MYESIYMNNELENEVSLDMSYFWYSDVPLLPECSSSPFNFMGYHLMILFRSSYDHYFDCLISQSS